MAKRLVLPEAQTLLQVEEYQPKSLSSGYIQVRNKWTSLNHLDWKRIEKNLFIPSFPHVLGMDVAGEVVDSGTSTKFTKGDIVLAPGLVGVSDSCSFQTHVLVDEKHCAKLEGDSLVPGLSTLPFCLSTAAVGLYLGLGLDRIARKDSTNNESSRLLIWGANGSVGKLAIQLAKLSGYFVIAVTSSEDTMETAKLRGADLVFHNADAEVVNKIHAASPKLRNAFDTVVTPKTIDKIVRCCAEPAKISTAIKYIGNNTGAAQVIPVFSGEIMGKTMTGQPSSAGEELGQWLWQELPLWIREKKVTPLEYEQIGDLSAVQTGLERMRDGSAKTKLVARVE